MYALQFQFKCPKRIVEKFLEKPAMMFLVQNARKFRPKYARMWLPKYRKEFAPRYLLSNALPNQEMFAAIFHGTSAIPFQNKFQYKNVSKYQDKFVQMFQRKNVILFHNRNARTGKLKIVSSNARTIIGVRNVHLDNIFE